MGVINPGSFDPITGAPIPAYTPVDSSYLNVSPDTLASSNLGTNSSTGIAWDASNPNLTIFGFSHLVGTSATKHKEAEILFDIGSNNYLDLYRNIVLTAESVKARITELARFKDDYNDYVDLVIDFDNEVQNLINKVNEEYDKDIEYSIDGNEYTMGELRAKLVEARNLVNNATTTTQAETDGYINTFLQWRAAFNGRIDALNGNPLVTNNEKTIYAVNEFINHELPFLLAESAHIAELIDEIGAQQGTGTLEDYENLSYYTPYATNAAFPPYPAGLYFDVDHDMDLGNDMVPKGNIPTAPGVSHVSHDWEVPAKITDDAFDEDYVKPLKEQLKAMKSLVDKTQEDISVFIALSLAFGQTTLSEQNVQPNAKNVTVGATGGGLLLSAIGSQEGQTIRMEEKFSMGVLDNLYNTFGVPQGSPIVATINGFAVDILQNLLLQSVTEGTQISQSGLVGASASSSPAVRAAVALATLEGAIGFVAEGVTGNAILELLLADPAFAGRSEAELKELANGIAAALNIIILKTFILQVSDAIGLSGLLPQILANLGSLSKDDVTRLINGQVSYKNLFDSPIDQALIRQSLASQLGEQNAEIAIHKAIQQLRELDPFESEEAARLALKQSILSELEKAGVDTTTVEPLVDRALPREATLPLNDQQILQSDLKQLAFENDLKARLLKSDFENDRIDRLIAEASLQTPPDATLEERAEIVETVLEDEGVENAPSITAQALASANNILRTPFVEEGIPVERPILIEEVAEVTTNLFVSQGVPVDQAEGLGERLGNLLFGEGPNSLTNLINLNVADYSKAVGKTQAENAEDLFKDSIRPTISTAAFLAKIADPANVLVFASNPIIYGDAGLPRTGPASGSPVNPIISV